MCRTLLLLPAPQKQKLVCSLFVPCCCCLLLLSHVRLLGTPWSAACQAPLPMRSPRQECWSGLPCPCCSLLFQLHRYVVISSPLWFLCILLLRETPVQVQHWSKESPSPACPTKPLQGEHDSLLLGAPSLHSAHQPAFYFPTTRQEKLHLTQVWSFLSYLKHSGTSIHP